MNAMSTAFHLILRSRRLPLKLKIALTRRLMRRLKACTWLKTPSVRSAKQKASDASLITPIGLMFWQNLQPQLLPIKQSFHTYYQMVTA